MFQQIEECLSREVTHVISDTPESKFPTSQTQCPVGPPSPWTPTQTPSPATSTSAVDSERRKCPLTAPPSRAEAILAKVRNTGKAKSTTTGSVLEAAKKFNCQLWTLSKTLQWLTKFKVKYGSSKANSSSRSGSEIKVEKKHLIAPAIKLENEANNTRPVYLELKSWPVLRFDGRPGSSPFSIPSSSKQKVKKLAKRLDVDRDEPLVKTAKKEEKQSCAQKKKTSGFCEICNTNFSELEKHLSTNQHQQFVVDQTNWTEVDQFCANIWSLV